MVKRKAKTEKIDWKRNYLIKVKILSILCFLAAIYYFSWLLPFSHAENLWLFIPLILAEGFNGLQAMGFWYTIWHQKWPQNPPPKMQFKGKQVDIFITICGEPAEIVEETIKAASELDYPDFKVYVLDDGASPKVKSISQKYKAIYISRQKRKGAKAGNINNALRLTDSEFIAIFDADHKPKPNFLKKTMPYFADKKVAFVQTPQFYLNKETNPVAAGSYEQQELFYGPICRGKNGLNAIFCCGTNVVFRRQALISVGGFDEKSVTEDLTTSLKLHKQGWRTIYLPEVLAYGLGPEDTESFLKQQLRWARGGLEMLFKGEWLFDRQLTFGQKVQYFLAGIFWFTGLSYLIYALLPLGMLFFQQKPVSDVANYPVHFIPYFLLTIYTLTYASEKKLTFRALWFTLDSFPVHITALALFLLRRPQSFKVTPKKALEKNGFFFVLPHLALISLLSLGIIVGVIRSPTAPILNNVAFALGHITILSSFLALASKKSVARLNFERSS
jgi:cellulose synthase (UDP-forming)